MKKKYTPYLLLIPQIILLVIFMIGLINGITQSFGVIPTFGLREPTLKYYQEVLSSSQMKSSILFSLYISFTSSIFAVIIAGGMISTEVSSGTIKFWALTPNKRWKILLNI